MTLIWVAWVIPDVTEEPVLKDDVKLAVNFIKT